ncbi:ERV1, Mitochondrial sulfhydryl oxidase the biogenesis of cytosolic FeS protein [Pyrenophora tritici-repentis]|nr:ERV1, Mitochondrial sulfhydryl oxidase the biogenesis of cytosolic FeS protein [Pyrenophora tritici-repentis]
MAQSSTETSEKQETDRTGYTKLANGIVLGPDGKPCRTCNDVKSLFAMSGKLPTKRTQSQPTTTTAAAPTLPADCPPDVEELGRSSWTLLHSITGAYPVNPSPQLQSETKSFLTTFGKLYPCWVCAEDFQAWMQKNTPRSHDSEASTLAPSTTSDCPSIYADTLPFSSDERPAPTHLFRLQPRKTFPEQSSPPPAQFRLQSRKTFPEVSHPVAQSRLQSRKSFADPPPTPKSRSQTTLPRRNSSLSQSQYDKQWWSEVGRRGSATAATRRLSVLEPVLEHDIRSRSCESKKPSKPEASKKNEVGSSRRHSSTHASWEGSRCESVMYDWTRPTDEEVRSKSTGKIFKGVDWNQGIDSVRGRQQERAELVESRDDSVYRMDWALKM